MKSGKELIKDPNVKQGSVRSILVVTQVRALDQSLSYAKQAKSLFQTSRYLSISDNANLLICSA